MYLSLNLLTDGFPRSGFSDELAGFSTKCLTCPKLDTARPAQLTSSGLERGRCHRPQTMPVRGKQRAPNRPVPYRSGQAPNGSSICRRLQRGAEKHARSQDFIQEGANLARAKVPPTKNQKLLGFDPLFSPKLRVFFLQ